MPPPIHFVSRRTARCVAARPPTACDAAPSEREEVVAALLRRTPTSLHESPTDQELVQAPLPSIRTVRRTTLRARGWQTRTVHTTIEAEVDERGNIRPKEPVSLPPGSRVLITVLEPAGGETALLSEASFHLGQLNEMAQRLPDPQRFVKAYVIKEALLSSAIEGIHTTMLDVFTQPVTDTPPNKATQLVLNYTDALNVALNLLKNNGMPICSRVILAAHETLMSAGEGDKATPGTYRKQSVRVGNLIPPPAPLIPKLITDLETYINEDTTLPALIQTGLIHVQFETIHPFLDGNGRIGRLLIVLMLIENGLLTSSILYPSHYFKKHHWEYYQQLDRVRTHGDFEGWISFYLTAIRDSSIDANRRAKEIEELERDLQTRIQTDPTFAKIQNTASDALDALFQMPVITIPELAKAIDKSYNTAQKIVTQFVNAKLLTEQGDKKRNRTYLFTSYLTVLEKEY